MTKPRIALVYDHVTTSFGGAEVVLDQLHQLYPEAPLFSTVADVATAHWARGWPLHTSFLQRLPAWLRRRHRWQALLAPIAAESLDLREFDIIISVSAGAGKGVLTRPAQLHICYLLAPTRYLYETSIFDAHRWLRLPGLHWCAVQALTYLRWWDRAAAGRPDLIVAISELVRQRTQSIYHLPVAQVLYPPYRPRTVALRTNTAALSVVKPYHLVISRLVWYKRVDVAIAAALHFKKRLVVVGAGPLLQTHVHQAGSAGMVRRPGESLSQFAHRAQAAGAQILFCGALPDAETTALLTQAQSLLMLGVEDFGMTALEALSLGKPVIINARAGVAELLSGKQGFILDDPTPNTVGRALVALDTQTFSPALLKKTALRYSDNVFRRRFAALVRASWEAQKAVYDNHS